MGLNGVSTGGADAGAAGVIEGIEGGKGEQQIVQVGQTLALSHKFLNGVELVCLEGLGGVFVFKLGDIFWEDVG